jgi:DNA primase catalytic core
MSNITDWIKYELYPTLFQSIDTALPEHNFKRYSGGWRSKTYLDGSSHKDRADKTVVSKKAPGYILENGGEVVGLVDYVMRRDRVEFIQAVKTLADVVGLQLPKGEFNQEGYQRYKDQATLLEDCNSYFIYCLENSKGADEVRAYLSSRGYSSEDIKAMELGYISDQDKLFKYLLSKGYSQTLIDEVVKLNKGIGSTHRLTIPYRSGGSVKGFKFRTTGDATPKYLNSTGLDRLGGFFNLSGIKGDKDVVIVEGELDSLSATARGVDNVVATGGSSISSDQVRDAIRRGAKSFTLCLDTEPGKEEETAKRLTSAIEVILGERINRVYIVTLPDLGGGKIDPDRLIKESGVEAFRGAIRGALPYYEYKLQETLNKYGKIEEEIGLQPKDIDRLLDEVVETASQIPDATDRDRYKKLFTSLEAIKGLGISEESLSITVDRLTSTRDKEAQAKEFKKLLSEATQLQDKGETDKALELLDSKVKEVRLKDKKASFNKLLEIPTEEDIKLHFGQHSESLRSGFYINKEELLLPSGGLTGIAGATGHGKTDFLINLTLNSVLNYPEKEFYFFTYEMSQEAILVRFLNSYLDIDLESYSNQRAIKTYFKTGSTQYIKAEARDFFTAKVKEFFKDIIGSGRLRVKGIDYTAPELNLALSELSKKANVGGFFIDYFQLLNIPKEGYKNYSRQEELKVICQDLNNTAKKLQLPIILGAQFNREVTTPFKLHPTNISEAGDIERILDTLIGIWFTNKKIVAKDLTKAEESDFKNISLDTPNKLYTYVLKSRETATDVYELLDYNGQRGKIKNSSSSGSSSGSSHFK